MIAFHEELSRIMNQPVNAIGREVTDFMETADYKTFADTVYPTDRTIYICDHNYRTLTAFLGSVKDANLFNQEDTDTRDGLLLEAMVHIHNYVSSQYALTEIIKNHAKSLPIKNVLLSQFSTLRKAKVTNFVKELRKNLVHETNFSNTLRFESKWGHCKIVYPVSELLKSNQWANAKGFVSSHTDFIIVEEVIEQYHNYLRSSLRAFETTLFKEYKSVFMPVLTTLETFSEKYRAAGVKGFLPVSDEYIKNKLALYVI